MQKVLIDSVARFSQARILCVGDVILDTYNQGTVTRISPESPIPVFNSGREESVPGGGANVAKNIAAFGGHCVLVGITGDDVAGKLLAEKLEALRTVTPAFIVDKTRFTSHKIRYVAQGQHMLRVDVEQSFPATEDVENQLIERACEAMETCQVVILSDYAKGTLTDRVISEITKAARSRGLPVVVDPKSKDFSRYSGATVLTPNLKEIFAAYGSEVREDDEVVAAARQLLASAGVENLIVTRSEMGMTLVHEDGSHVHIRSEAREVFDVVGAGDTVIATLALGVASGLDLAMSTQLSNTAAGIVVAKHGTATVSPKELVSRLGQEEAHLNSPKIPLLLTAEEASNYANECRARGERVGFTNGVFDIVHPGHISILNFARMNCDRLIVGVNSDASVKRLNKGPERPINSQNDRATVLSAFDSVDAVTIFNQDTPLELIQAIRPDVLIKGADYTVETVVGADFVQSYSGTVKLAPIIPGKSSTGIIKRMKSSENKQ